MSPLSLNLPVSLTTSRQAVLLLPLGLFLGLSQGPEVGGCMAG